MYKLPNDQIVLEREDWGATLTGGPPRVDSIIEAWIHHTVTIADDDHSLESTDDVVADMKEIEDVGETRFGRFPYSFCFHPSGIIAEGGGWDVIGAHTANHNSRGVGLAAIGNYEVNTVPELMYNAFVNLLVWGKSIGKLPNIKLPTGGHRDVKQTACPGFFLYNTLPAMVFDTSLNLYIPEPEEEEVAKGTYAIFPNSPDPDIVYLVALNSDPRKVGTFAAMEYFMLHENFQRLEPPPGAGIEIADGEGTVRNVMVVQSQEHIYGIETNVEADELTLEDVKDALAEVLSNTTFSVVN